MDTTVQINIQRGPHIRFHTQKKNFFLTFFVWHIPWFSEIVFVWVYCVLFKNLSTKGKLFGHFWHFNEFCACFITSNWNLCVCVFCGKCCVIHICVCECVLLYVISSYATFYARKNTLLEAIFSVYVFCFTILFCFYGVNFSYKQ